MPVPMPEREQISKGASMWRNVLKTATRSRNCWPKDAIAVQISRKVDGFAKAAGRDAVQAIPGPEESLPAVPEPQGHIQHTLDKRQRPIESCPMVQQRRLSRIQVTQHHGSHIL